MSMEGAFVPGLFSQAGRSTAFEIESLQNQLNLNVDDKDHKPVPTNDDKHSNPKAYARAKMIRESQGAPGAAEDDLHPKTPGGELAKAIAAKLRVNDEGQNKAIEKNASKSMVPEKSEPLSVPFSCEGKEGNYATKFTASFDIGALNHRKEQMPENPYKVRHEAVLHRFPQWDFQEHATTQPIVKPPGHSDPMAFLTGVDIEDKDAINALTAQQRSMLKRFDIIDSEKPKPKFSEGTINYKGGSMSLNSGMGPLGKMKSCRTQIPGQEVSCAYDSDLLEQDIKGYQKLRYPKWDMEAPAARGPLIKADSLGEPGKYDVNLDCVMKVSKAIGIGFGKALPRSQFVGHMGYSAPPAILHPEDKRTRGLLPDRSRGKDNVRPRPTNVNDFDTEIPRPPLLTGASTTYHDEHDPAACEAVLQRYMNYDADTSDVYVTHRRDIAPKYKRMIGRGKEAYQGLRALSSDLAVRGSVGLGFVETKSFADSSQIQREARHMDGSKENPNIGPNFDYRTVNVHNRVTEMCHRGRPLVKGTGHDAKYAARTKKDQPVLVNAFKRSGSMPGFESRAKFGGTRVLAQSRSSTAMPGWAPSELDSIHI